MSSQRVHDLLAARRCRWRPAHRGSRRCRRASASKRSAPASIAASTLASPMPRVLWKCSVSSVPREALAEARASSARPGSGSAMPVVSHSVTPRTPSVDEAARTSRAPSSSGTSPSIGQPKAARQRHVDRHPGRRRQRDHLATARRSSARASCAGWPGCASRSPTSRGSARRRATRWRARRRARSAPARV